MTAMLVAALALVPREFAVSLQLRALPATAPAVDFEVVLPNDGVLAPIIAGDPSWPHSRVELDMAALINLADRGAGVVCSVGASPPSSQTRHRYLLVFPNMGVNASAAVIAWPWATAARTLCNASAADELLGRLEWSAWRVEYYPGREAWAAAKHVAGILTFGSAAYLRSHVMTSHFLPSKIAWAEATGRPLWLFRGSLAGTVARHVSSGALNESALGAWWSTFKAQLPVANDGPMWSEAWQKPLHLLEAVRSGRFEFIAYVDADTYVPVPTVDIASMLPRRATNAAFAARLDNASEADVHLVVPLKRMDGRLRFSNWFFVISADPWSEAFLLRWLAHSDCDWSVLRPACVAHEAQS